jgi:hypothetical protein
MKRINRRQFLKIAGTTAGVVVFAEGCKPKAASTASATASTGASTIAATPTITPTINQTPVILKGKFIAGCGRDCTVCPLYQTCGGCFSEKCTNCTGCTLKACTNRHNVSNCGECSKYPCDDFETFLKNQGTFKYQNQKAVLDEVHRVRG